MLIGTIQRRENPLSQVRHRCQRKGKGSGETGTVYCGPSENSRIISALEAGRGRPRCFRRTLSAVGLSNGSPTGIRGFRRESTVAKNPLFNRDVKMDTEERNKELANKLESYLSQACKAEAARDFEEAERCFKYALFYEGKLRPDVSSPKQYVVEAGPVHQKTPPAAGANDLAVCPK
jgi:hypothetical protein